MPTTRKPGPKPGPRRLQVTTTLKPKTRKALEKINPILGKAIDALAESHTAYKASSDIRGENLATAKAKLKKVRAKLAAKGAK